MSLSNKAMTERDRATGRFAHAWDHAGFDRDGEEWAVCFHCGKFRVWSDEHGEYRIHAKAPPVTPGRQWTAAELAFGLD